MLCSTVIVAAHTEESSNRKNGRYVVKFRADGILIDNSRKTREW